MTCFVYLICPYRNGEFVGPVKIGVSENVPLRLKQIQTGCPRKLGIFAMFPVQCPDPENDRSQAKGYESFLHAYSWLEVMEGEWFDIEPYEAYRNALAHLFVQEDGCRWLQDMEGTLRILPTLPFDVPARLLQYLTEEPIPEGPIQ